MTALRTEETALLFGEAGLAVQTVASRAFMGAGATGSVETASATWDTACSEVRTAGDRTNLWQLVTLTPRSSPSIVVSFALDTVPRE